MMRAHCSSGKPPTPVPNAGSAIDVHSSPSATSRHRRVVCAMASPFVRRSCPITAPCTTYDACSRPAPVATASPTAIGPFATASLSISSPPARLIAPATPAPIQRWSFAAFAIASTSSAVMSPSTTSSWRRPPIIAATLARAGEGELCLVGQPREHLQLELVERLVPPWPGDEEAHPLAVERERGNGHVHALRKRFGARDVAVQLRPQTERLCRVGERPRHLDGEACGEDKGTMIGLQVPDSGGRQLRVRRVLQPERDVTRSQDLRRPGDDGLLDVIGAFRARQRPRVVEERVRDLQALPAMEREPLLL